MQFHQLRLRTGFAGTPRLIRLVAGVLWALTATDSATTVALDHRRLLRSLKMRPYRFVLDALGDFAGIARTVLTAADSTR